jgi:hypothetical protein
LAIAGTVLFCQHYAQNQTEDVIDHEHSDEVIDNHVDREISENSGRRKSLSVLRSNLSTLSLPSIKISDIGEEVSPGWGEHNFYTPQPYKTPHTGSEDEKKLTFRSIPIMRT